MLTSESSIFYVFIYFLINSTELFRFLDKFPRNANWLKQIGRRKSGYLV